MPCNCSNEYCYDKFPEGAVVRDSDGEPVSIHLVNVKLVKMKQTISWSDWLLLCDSERVDKVGWRWVPYVPIKI